MVTPV